MCWVPLQLQLLNAEIAVVVIVVVVSVVIIAMVVIKAKLLNAGNCFNLFLFYCFFTSVIVRVWAKFNAFNAWYVNIGCTLYFKSVFNWKLSSRKHEHTHTHMLFFLRCDLGQRYKSQSICKVILKLTILSFPRSVILLLHFYYTWHIKEISTNLMNCVSNW